MANPLTFEFGIKDNLSTKLEEIEKKLGKLQEGVKVDIRLSDVSEIQKLFDNLDPSKINNITEAIKNLNRAMNVVVDKQGSFKTVQQFVDAEQAARNLASAVEKIDFGKVDSTGKISNMTNEMKAFRDALRDYNEKMVNVQPFKAELSTQALAEFKSSIDKTLSGISVKLGVELDNKTITKDFGIYKGINEAMDYLKKNFSTVNAEVVAPKVDTTALDAAEKKVAELRKELADLQGEPVKPAVDSSQMNLLNRQIADAEASLKRLQEQESHALAGFGRLEETKSDAIKKFTKGLFPDNADMHGVTSSVGVNVEKQFELLKDRFEKGLKMTKEYETSLRWNLAQAFVFNPTDASVSNGAIKYLQEIYDRYKAIRDDIKGPDKSLSPALVDIRNDAKSEMSAASALIKLYKELASTIESINKSGKKEGWIDADNYSNLAYQAKEAKKELSELLAKKAELEKAPPAPDNSARINQINQQIAAQEKLIAENKKAQEQMKAPLQDATPFNAFSQGFTLAATEIYNAYNTIEKKLREVREALGETGFTNLKTKAEAAATAISKLSEAFEKLGVSFEANKELKNMLVGLGEIVSKIRQAIPAGDASGLGTQDIAENVRKNRDSIAKALYDIQRAREKVFEAKSIGQDNGMTAPQLNKLEMYIQYLDSYAKKLREVSQDSARMTMPNAVGDVIDKMARTRIGAADGLLREAKDCESASNRMKEAFLQIDSMRERLALKRTAGNGIINTSEIERQMRELDDFKAKLMGIGNVKTRVKVFGGEWSQMSKQMEGVLQRSERLIENTKKYNNNLDAGTVVVEKLKNAIQNASDPKLSIDTTAAQNALAKIEQWMQKLGNVDLNNPNAFVELERQFKRLKSEGNNAAKEIERAFNRATTTKDSYGDISHQIEFMKRQMLSISDLMAKAGKFNIDTTALAKFNSELEKSIRMLEQAQASGNKKQMSSAWLSSKTISDQATTEQRRIQNEVNRAKADGAAATQKLTAEEQKLADAIKNATNAGKQQNQVLSDLRTMAMQYWSVQGAYNFAKEMANITGELELQKTSLQVILNNASKADELYGQIRDLSQMSPFSFMDLMKSTRQLAAFGIETKDLYGTMKSLSDIGAGLNVDVNRLILAYGHTRSYGYLSGIQNRQFENAGIDMIGGLVKQYNDLAKAEEEAGRKADYVTRKDIFKRMRDKSIDFADVEKVILGLDQPGGKFYDMQLKQFDTLGGKLRNLANNYNIMMSELGEKHRGVLMAVVEGLTEVHEHWYRYERIIYGVVAALGAMKAAQLAVGASSIAMNKTLLSQTVANSQALASSVYLNNYSTKSQKFGGNFMSNTANMLRATDANAPATTSWATVKEIQSNKEINALTKQRIALTGQLTRAQRVWLLTQNGVSQGMAHQLAYMSTFNRHLASMRLALIQAGTAMRAFAASMLTNPVTWIMAAVGGITWLIQKMGETKEQAQGIADAIHDAAQKDIAGIKESLDTYSNLFTESDVKMKGIGGNNITRSIVSVKEAELQTRNVKDIFDDLKRSLQSQAPLYSMSLFDVFKFKDEAKQVEAIIQKKKDIQYVREVQDLTRDAFQDAIESTGGWRDLGTEGVIKNITDFSDNLTSTISTIRDDIKNSWSKLPKDIQDSIDKAASGINMSREQYIQQLLLKDKKSSVEMKMYNAMRSNLLSFSPRSFSALGEGRTMMSDIKPVADQMAREFNDAYKGNVDMMKEAFQSHMLQIFTSSKIAESAKPYVAQEFALAVSEGLKGVQGNDADSKAFLANYYKSLMSSAIQDGMKAINANTLPADVERITKEAIDKATKSVESSYPEIARAFAGLGKTAKEAFDKEMQDFADSYAKHLNAVQGWQLDMRTKSPFLAGRINSAGSWAEFWDNAKKEFKKGSEELKLYAQKAKIDLKIDVGMSYDTKKLKAMFDAAKAKADALKPMAETTFANDPNIRGQYDAAKALADNLENLYEIASLAEKEHVSLKDDKKGNQKDHMQEMWRNRIKYIQEAYNAYKQWKKEVGDNDVNGEDPAMKIVDNKFGKYLKEAFGKDFDLKNIKEYQKFLKEMMKMVENTTFKQKDTKRNFLSQLEGMYSQTELAVIQEKSKEVADAFKQNITDIEKKYEMFRSIIEVTGDTDLASRMLGYDYQWQNKADLIKRELDKVLEDAGLVGKINIGANTSDTDIDRIVKANMNTVDEKGNPIEEEIKKVNEVVEALKKFRDVTQEVMKDSISQYTELIKSATGYQQKITDIETEYKKALEALKGIKDETERNRAEGIARDKRDTALMEASAPYRNLMSNSLTTSKEDAKNAYATAYAQYSQNFKDGVIGADEYTKKIQELNKALRDIDNGAVSEWILFLQGGMKAVREQRIKIAEENMASASREREVAQSEYMDAFGRNDYKAMDAAIRKRNNAEQKFNKAKKDKEDNEKENDKTDKFNNGINAIVEGLNKFNSGLNLVNSTLDALGLGDTAIGNAAKDASTIMNSTMQGAQALSAFGPWGQAAGAALGIVGGIMQVHDAKLERQITELKQDISKIENYNKTLAKSAERQLGYSRTSNVSALAKMYSSDKSAAGKAMAEYYRNASGSGSYTTYQQEYNNAIEERKKYLEMYNAEEAKKKTDTNALEEYKSKIAELDEQIRYFAEDTAKELWGIDVKSWADQLSDALSTAWQNGTSLAIAYGDTVKSILQSVAKQMLTIGIIQPMFEELQNTIFGKDGKDGLFDINNPEQSMAKVTDYLAKYFGDGGNGQKTITAANEFWNGIEQVLNQYGISAKTSGSSTLSSGIKGMSEETANLLAGYVNALRQDVSAMRVMQAEFFKRYWEVRESGNYDDTNTILAEGKRYDLSTVNDNTSAMLVLETVFVNQYWNDYVQTYTAAYKSLGNIEQQVAAMARVQSKMSDTLSDFYSKFNRVTNGTEHLYIK